MKRRWIWSFLSLICLSGCHASEDTGVAIVDECPDDPLKLAPGACGCGVVDIFDVSQNDYTCNLAQEDIDYCPNNPLKKEPGICGCNMSDEDLNRNGIPDCLDDAFDLCPDDPDKKLPGICGCGVPDDDDNNDGVPNCLTPMIDLCPDDPKKTAPGDCGCGMPEIEDGQGGSLCDSLDLCPNDADKTNPGVCGCGVPDVDRDGNDIPDCLDDAIDLCPDDPEKTLPGLCGCGVSDGDIDEVTNVPQCIADEIDLCPENPDKTRPGICGCAQSDELDEDGDGVPDCIDSCPQDPDKSDPGVCGCGIADSDVNLTDSDGDGSPDCIDACPSNPWKSEADECDCNAYKTVSNAIEVCAQIISSASEWLEVRDAWNAHDENLTATAFILMKDINLGDVLTQSQASQWVGIGTAERPFNAIFIGNDHVINAVRTSGKTTEILTLGNAESNDIALFSYTQAARIESLVIKLSVTGRDHVAGLVANASETTLSQIEVSESSIAAETISAAVAAEFRAGTMKSIAVSDSTSVSCSGNTCGGVSAQVSASQLSSVRFSGTLTGNQETGGIAANLTQTSLVNAFADGVVSGGKYTASLVGKLLSRSSLYNVFSTATIHCREAGCAALVASIDDYSTMKNVYTTSFLVSEIEPEGRENPETPVVTGEGETTDDASTGGDTEDPVENQMELEIPIAALVASFESADNVLDKTYYWNNADIQPLPTAAYDMKYVSTPIAFTYVLLVPYTVQSSERLVDVLSSNLTCYTDNTCILDGFSCQKWTTTLYRQEEMQRTVTIPWLSLSMD